MLYQRVSLSTGQPVGAPGPLPADLVGGLSDADLAQLGAIVSDQAPQYADAGFLPVADPAEPRWLHKVLLKLRFTAAERIAIKAAAASSPELADAMDLLDSADLVDLDDANLVGTLDALVGLGLLTAGRPAEIRA